MTSQNGINSWSQQYLAINCASYTKSTTVKTDVNMYKKSVYGYIISPWYLNIYISISEVVHTFLPGKGVCVILCI